MTFSEIWNYTPPPPHTHTDIFIREWKIWFLVYILSKTLGKAQCTMAKSLKKFTTEMVCSMTVYFSLLWQQYHRVVCHNHHGLPWKPMQSTTPCTITSYFSATNCRASHTQLIHAGQLSTLDNGRHINFYMWDNGDTWSMKSYNTCMRVLGATREYKKSALTLKNVTED